MSLLISILLVSKMFNYLLSCVAHVYIVSDALFIKVNAMLSVDFECILDKELKPLPYTEPSSLQIPDRGQVQWGADSHSKISDELPPGAQR